MRVVIYLNAIFWSLIIVLSVLGVCTAFASEHSHTTLASQNSPCPIPTGTIKHVDSGRNFLVFEDSNAAFENMTNIREPAPYPRYDCLAQIIEPGFLAAHPDNSRELAIFTAFEPYNNDGRTYFGWHQEVQGVGGRIKPDLTQGMLEGAVWMNDYRRYTLGGVVHADTKRSVQKYLRQHGYTTEADYLERHWLMPYEDMDPRLKKIGTFNLKRVFVHEFAHKLTGKTFYNAGGQTGLDNLLGVEKAHWGFYHSTATSPMEGNDWQPVEGNRFVAKLTSSYKFSDLDLYLLGLLPPEDVQPFFYIDNPHSCKRNGRPITCWENDRYTSNHFYFTNTETRSVAGEAKFVTLENIIDYNGPRIPDHTQVTKDIPMSFVVLVREGQTIDEVEKERIATMVDRMAFEWGEATGGLSKLIIK